MVTNEHRGGNGMKIAYCEAEGCSNRPNPGRRFCSRACGARTLGRIKRRGQLNSNWRGGKTQHPLYDVYMDMIGRCYRSTHARFADYGGRGITVCDRWRENFWDYVADVGNKPTSPGRWSLDRIDNNEGYGPTNTRWATSFEQAQNKRGYGWESRERDEMGRFT